MNVNAFTNVGQTKLTVGNIYYLVFHDREFPIRRLVIYDQCHRYDHLFTDFENPHRTHRVEDWELRKGIVEIIPTEFPTDYCMK